MNTNSYTISMLTKKCKTCGKLFEVISSSGNKGDYCSKECHYNRNGGKVIILCETCGEPFEVIQSKKDRSKYCSRECYINKNGGRIIKICKTCGKVFKVKQSHGKRRKYCSKECYDNRNGEVIIKICKTCGESFSIQPCHEDQIYCSKECYTNNSPSVIKICEICGCEFKVQNCRKDTARFCSMECQGVWQSKTRVGENGANWQNNIIQIKCKYCGKIIFTTPCYDGYKIFCCKDCMSKWQSENVFGKNHPQYKDKVLKICENCGLIFKVHVSEYDRRFCSLDCYGEYRNNNSIPIKQRIKQSCTMRGISIEDFDGFVAGDWRDWKDVIYMNDHFIGCHRHHITETLIIHIPGDLHNHISHNLRTGVGMDVMNVLALQFINGYHCEDVKL